MIDKPYAVLVSRADSIDNDVDGIRSVELQVPFRCRTAARSAFEAAARDWMSQPQDWIMGR